MSGAGRQRKSLQSPPADAATVAHGEKLEALGRFGGHLAHEFSNITQVIMTATDILELRLGLDNPATARYLALIRRGTDRARELTDRLRSFSGSQPLAPVAVPVNDVVARAAAALRESCGPRIRVETVLHPDAGEACADPAALQAVLRALVDNACEALRGAGRICLETGPADPASAGQARGRPWIAVRDDGVGMPAQVLARAGEPFFTTKPAGHGAGVGLAQVYGFVRQAGGCVDIDSAPGAGTTVRIYLPIDPAAQAHGFDGAGDQAGRDGPELPR